MDKNLVKELYLRGDRKRKIALFKVYSEWISMDTSLKFIRDRINKDLGFDLITEQEVKYVRHHFLKGSVQVSAAEKFFYHKTTRSTIDSNEGDINWTIPETISSNQNILKSKFSKEE